jgi:hypothetical protein
MSLREMTPLDGHSRSPAVAGRGTSSGRPLRAADASEDFVEPGDEVRRIAGPRRTELGEDRLDSVIRQGTGTRLIISRG